MATHVALLRGINVGGRSPIRMQHPNGCFSSASISRSPRWFDHETSFMRRSHPRPPGTAPRSCGSTRPELLPYPARSHVMS
ncbi:DUF1697 domain-containing protein [Agromyces sp. NPDC049794]